MYILINRDNMSFLFKHESARTVANLAWIEDRFSAQHIFPIDDATGFQVFTDLELMLLYKSIAGEPECAEKRRLHLIQIIYDLVDSAKATIADNDKAQAQADHIPDESKVLYRYNHKSFKPSLVSENYKPKQIKVERNMTKEALATSGKLPSLKRIDPDIIAAKMNKLKATVPVSNKPVKSGPKRGTAKSIIWNTADAMWNEAGKPTDKTEILNLRKLIMNKLEEDEGIKRTSASSELGQWNKARV